MVIDTKNIDYCCLKGEFSRSRYTKYDICAFCKLCASDKNKEYREKCKIYTHNKEPKKPEIVNVPKGAKTKVCYKCKRTLTLDCFYESRITEDKLFGKCKKCCITKRPKYTSRNWL